METCGRCQGIGYEEWDEDGRPQKDVCYRCCGTGEISEESARALRLDEVAGILASVTVEAMRKACNANPDGEDWSFCAAESMMTERDYTVAMTMDYTASHGKEISQLSDLLQDALIHALLERESRR